MINVFNENKIFFLSFFFSLEIIGAFGVCYGLLRFHYGYFGRLAGFYRRVVLGEFLFSLMKGTSLVTTSRGTRGFYGTPITTRQSKNK